MSGDAHESHSSESRFKLDDKRILATSVRRLPISPGESKLFSRAALIIKLPLP